MKLYSDTIAPMDFYAILVRLRSGHLVGDDVFIDKLKRKDGRKRKHSYDFHIASSTKEPGSKRRHPNSGWMGYDGSEVWAATYDEWGWLIAALYEADPDALTVTYGTQAQFHQATDNQYKLR